MRSSQPNIATVLIAGDTCPYGRNEKLFKTGSVSDILGDVAPVVKQSDLFILNLECPLTASDTPTAKIGPSLKADPLTVNGLTAMGVDVVGIANNHMMDFGEEGLFSTIDLLKEKGVGVVGGGANLKEAWRVVERVVNGIRVGIVAVAEHEFGIAGALTPGVCPLDHYGFHSRMQSELAHFDHIIVLLHGGNEHYAYPRPGLVESARFFASLGASAVICQHSHIVGCYERYGDAHIVYGQGNFIFDYPTDRKTWSEGVLVQLSLTAADCTVEFFPITQENANSAVSLLSGERRARVLDDLQCRSKALDDPAELERQWLRFCNSVERFYLHSLHGRAGIFRRIMGRLGYLHLLDSKKANRTRLNLIRCESHREALLSVLTHTQKK